MPHSPTRTRGGRAAVAAFAVLALGAVLGAPQASAASPAVAPVVAATPPMGWNTWNTFGCDISEDLIKQAADALVGSGMKAAGYQYVVVDDCWMEPTRDAAGNLRGSTTRFPHGMKALGDYIHGKGLKFGIYEVPTDLTCAQRPGHYPGATGSLGHEQQDANTFASWGVDYLKYDWCSPDGDLAYQQQRFTVMRDALRATGRPIVYSINPNSYHDEKTGAAFNWGGIANLWRTTEDIGTFWNTGNTNSYPMGVRNILALNGQPAIADQAGPGHWNDPDMLEVGVGTGLSNDEARAHFSLWALMGAPLLAGNDLRSMTAPTNAILTDPDVIAVDQDPLGDGGRRAADDSGLQMWVKRLADGDRAVALFNDTGVAATIGTTAAAAGIGGADSYTIKDLWSKAVTTNATGVVRAAVPPHAAALYRITPSGTAPAAPVVSGGVYRITAAGQAVDDPNFATAAGTPLIGWHVNGGDNQKWTLTANGDGTWAVRNLSSGLCADVSWVSVSPGAAVVQWTCTGAVNQRWIITPSGSGYALTSANSGLVLTAASTADNAPLTQQADTSSTTQSWTFTRLS
ncbi:alpha-galactosidase [Kitasatospora sp. NPDC049285]|uniref:alpha-galactosidase n=1 Tax=Kitasatospora sp. NPDC049285 TaxID=3157096 RepID=UPI00342BF9A5